MKSLKKVSGLLKNKNKNKKIKIKIIIIIGNKY